jgi:hypothetical protein
VNETVTNVNIFLYKKQFNIKKVDIYAS